MLRTVIIKILPHPQFKGDWLVECRELLPNALWYRRREDAINYATLLGKDCCGEVRVLRGDGSTVSVIALPQP